MPPAAPTGSSRVPASLRGTRLDLSYGARAVVHDVSIALEPGRATALIGPNGSGKSTLLRALARLHPAPRDAVTIGGADREDRPVSLLTARAFAHEVTLFSQSRPAPQGLSVGEVVAFGRHPHRRRFAGLTDDDRRAIDHAMLATGVRDMATRPVGELSGGEMQRVWLAACVAQETGVVLLDEPTNHLDLRYQIETLDLVRDLVEETGVAVGIVLHDLDHAARVADELILMHAGRVHAAGIPAEVLTAEHLREVYGIEAEVEVHPRSGRVRIDPIGRHAPLAHRAPGSEISHQTTDPSERTPA
ncbi:ABC transporter ATP-binding protein [Leucobacter japonicus]|uniref:ABC transporter ATP-binding protein n=1 Tax=Leucobacter japonicus TaxID=1461259 RepID=UPI0009E44C6C|nr:ABC transporter ATP-binding protein [Leucobacter japonicus]